jgi:hypothetical protein
MDPLRPIRTLVVAFATAVAVAGTAAPAAAVIQDIAGTYTGTWNNTTFGSSGGAELQISFAGSDATFLVDMDGSAFGLVDPDPVSFGGTVVAGDLQVDATGTVPYGHVEGSIDGDTGAVDFLLTMTSRPDIASVDVTGTVAGGTMDLDYTVNIMGFGMAVGTLVATLPEPGVVGGLAAWSALAVLASWRRRGPAGPALPARRCGLAS